MTGESVQRPPALTQDERARRRGGLSPLVRLGHPYFLSVTQTIEAGHNEYLPGNCLQAAVASFFARPLDEVPHFVLFNSWHEALNLWLADWYDLAARIRPYDDAPHGRYLLIGGSPRNRDWTHVVVAEDEQIVWDPHPSRAGLTDRRRTVVFYDLPTTEAIEGPPDG